MKQTPLVIVIVGITLFFVYGNCQAQITSKSGFDSVRKAIQKTNAKQSSHLWQGSAKKRFRRDVCGRKS
jgi:hypothetical protein